MKTAVTAFVFQSLEAITAGFQKTWKTSQRLFPSFGMLAVLLFLSSATAQAAVLSPAEAVAPTAKAPFTVPTDPAAKKILVQQIKDYMALPPAQVRAHPAAADFPGIAPAGSPRVTRVVTVHGPKMHGPDSALYAGRKDGWQSTGLYANAGEIVTVTPVGALPAGVTVEIQVGCHTDRLFNDKIDKWKRFPSIARSFPLTQQATPVANAFGGPLFVSVKNAKGATSGELNIGLRFANAVEAPFFVLGKTSLADWKKIRQAPAPWGELVGRGMILHSPAAQVRNMEDPTALLEWWDKVIAAEDGLVGWPARAAQERVVPDRQISAGWMHSGYPFMCHLASAPMITDLAALRTKGDWGFFHELGHNHQSADWTFSGQTEVTVNFFSLYCMEHIVGKPTGTGHGALDGEKLFKALDRRLGTPPSTDPFDQLAPFVVLLRKYGWEPLQKTLVSYQAAPLARKMPEPQRQAEFVRRYSRNAKADLTGYFKQLGYACPDELCTELKALPAFDYAAWRKEPTGSKQAKL